MVYGFYNSKEAVSLFWDTQTVTMRYYINHAKAWMKRLNGFIHLN